MDSSDTVNTEVYAALQEFKTCFDLAKSTAGSLPKVATPETNNEQNSNGDEVKPKPPTLEVPQVVDGYLELVSKRGTIIHPWKVVKPLLLFKLDAAMRSYNNQQPFDSLPTMPNCAVTSFHQMYSAILKATDKFKQAPFTVQRICELICFPERHYKRVDKYMYALEKNTAVVTTVDEKGRKLSTSAETDLSVPDTQQTEKLIALFDWMNASTVTSNDATSSSDPTSTDVSPSTSGQVTLADTASFSPASVSTDNTNAECSTSADSTDGESVQQEPASRSAKRLMSEEADETSREQLNKRVRLDVEDSEQVDSSVDAAGEESCVQTSESSSDVALNESTEATQSGREDITSQSSDTLTDSIAEELPVDEPVHTTSDDVNVTSEMETDDAAGEPVSLAEGNSSTPSEGDVAKPPATTSSAGVEQKADDVNQPTNS